MPIKRWVWNGTSWTANGRTDVTPLDPFVLGTTRPTALNTGLTTATDTTITATTNVSANNTVWENTRFENWVSVTAKSCTFRNCEFVGPASFSPIDRGLVNCSNSNVEDLLFDRCKFRPQTPTRGLDGIFGHSFTARRCDVSGTEDGFGVYRASGGALRTSIEGCYVHLPHYICPNPFQSDNRSHCDGVQVHGNIDDLTIIGCDFDWFIDTSISSWSTPTYSGSTQITGYQYYPRTDGLSPIFFGVPGSVIRDLLVTQNWLDGAKTSFVNFHPSWTAASTNAVVSNNRLGRSHAASNDAYVFSVAASVGLSITGNYYLDTGAQYNTRSNP